MQHCMPGTNTNTKAWHKYECQAQIQMQGTNTKGILLHATLYEENLVCIPGKQACTACTADTYLMSQDESDLKNEYTISLIFHMNIKKQYSWLRMRQFCLCTRQANAMLTVLMSQDRSDLEPIQRFIFEIVVNVPKFEEEKKFK